NRASRLPNSPFLSLQSKRAVILSERANAREAKDLLEVVMEHWFLTGRPPLPRLSGTPSGWIDEEVRLLDVARPGSPACRPVRHLTCPHAGERPDGHGRRSEHVP